MMRRLIHARRQYIVACRVKTFHDGAWASDEREIIMIFWRKEKELEKGMAEYLEEAQKCLATFSRAIDVYFAEGLSGGFEQLVEETHHLEAASDVKRREIDRQRQWADQLLNLWTQGAIKPKIARTFSFAEAPQAHHFVQDRRNIGKVLLMP